MTISESEFSMNDMTANHTSCHSCDARRYSLIAYLTSEQRETVTQTKLCKFYPKGVTIFSAGQYPFGVYCLRSGKVKISTTGVGGREQILRFAKNGDILGYHSLLADSPNEHTATTIENSTVCIIPSSVFFNLVRDNPPFSFSLMKLLANDVAEADRRILQISQKSVRERVAEALLLIERTYGADGDNNAINVLLTREELAGIVGTATESVIRTLSQLKQEGLIRLDGKCIQILQRKQLAKTANIFD